MRPRRSGREIPLSPCPIPPFLGAADRCTRAVRRAFAGRFGQFVVSCGARSSAASDRSRSFGLGVAARSVARRSRRSGCRRTMLIPARSASAWLAWALGSRERTLEVGVGVLWLRGQLPGQSVDLRRSTSARRSCRRPRVLPRAWRGRRRVGRLPDGRPPKAKVVGPPKERPKLGHPVDRLVDRSAESSAVARPPRQSGSSATPRSRRSRSGRRARLRPPRVP